MKRQWHEAELAEQFTLTSDEHTLIAGKDRKEENRLGFAVLLKFFQAEGRFPRYKYEVPRPVLEYIARGLTLAPALFKGYPWSGRTIEHHRRQIRQHLSFQTSTVQDRERLTLWLLDEVFVADTHPEFVRQRFLARCRALKIEPPSPGRIERIIRSALRRYEEAISGQVAVRLTEETCRRLDALLEPYEETGYTIFRFLDRERGRTSLATAEREIDKLKRIRALGLPENLFEGIPARLLEQYRQRAAAEPPRELRRHPDPVRYTLLAAFCHLKSQQITDTLAELLIQLPRKMEANAEKAIEQAYLSDIKTVRGKHRLLLDLAEAALEHPDGTVREVLYPVVSPETLRDLVREFRASGLPYAQQVYSRMRSSYSHHYRRLMPALVEALRFRSNNEQHQPVIEALELIQRHLGRKTHHFADDEAIPLDDIVPPDAEHLVLRETEAGTRRVNRIGYEVCTLLALRERLRSKAVWIEGARRFGNPDRDVPEDFAAHRTAYYRQLNLPLEAEVFITGLRGRMQEALAMLDRGMPQNEGVRIRDRRGRWISVTPLEKLPDPPNIQHLKNELGRRWPLTSLLDILKETDLRVSITDAFTSSGTREHLDRRTLQKRLLLCLYGLGTNTGLKRMSGADPEVSYDDLLYVRRRFIRQDSLREAIVRVSNALFRARLTHIWGEATTACASDAKKFSAWDQNLMTEWHIRYRGPGIMIYWHVEKGTSCIYSQLKRPSSSEVAAMIQGLLSHGTEMDVQKNYVDTHGQSEIAFAFCHLLGFDLLPRLKNIYKQRLSRPVAGQPGAYPNLQPVLTRPIRWGLIGKHYDEMVKYATALRQGTADAETILRRFTRGSVQHPIYRALAELGKAVKTIFLCRYLHRSELRREIHEGLQVIENWNSANGFIFFGNGREIMVNRKDDQEIAMLSMHLLQNSLVYINTLMIQQVLAEPSWYDRLTPEDRRALRPLQYAHVNPYGNFVLDMSTRLALEPTTENRAESLVS